MTIKFADRVKVSTSSTGTGTISLGSAVDGFQTFAQGGILNGNSVRYTITNGDSWEVGTGVYASSGTQMTRSYESSSTGSLLNLSGTSEVFITVASADINNLADTIADKLPLAGGTMTGSIRLDQDALSAGGGTLTIDLDAANNFKITMSANTTFAFSNVSVGRGGNLIIIQNATGGHSFTLPAACKTPVNGASIVQSTNANEISILSYYVVDSSNILINYIGDFA